jgi:hypothetical protein
MIREAVAMKKTRTVSPKNFAAALLICGTVVSLGTVHPVIAGNIPGTACPAFPADSWWHADVSRLPVHARSGQWMSHMSPTSNLHPDFGPSFGAQRVPYGIPITVVDSTHPHAQVSFVYSSESDHLGYPLGKDTKVEGGQWVSGDRHTVVVDKDSCRLYETWATHPSGGRWFAGSGASWRLTAYALRPDSWTSADAAGLAILPGLLHYREVVADRIDHAIRFTTNVTSNVHLWPARHHAGSTNDPAYPPMGARFRLKASYEIPASVSIETRRVLLAMKKYGLVLADNGSPWFFQGTSDPRWNIAMIDELKQIPASAFEAVDTSSLMISPDSMKIRQ